MTGVPFQHFNKPSNPIQGQTEKAGLFEISQPKLFKKYKQGSQPSYPDTYGDDLAGNRTQSTTPSTTTYFDWDVHNRLTQAVPVAGPVTMSYDGDGRRNRRQTPTQTRRFVFDFEKVLQDTDDSGLTQKQYASTEEQYGDLLSAYGSGQATYYAYDGLGSTDALLAPDGSSPDRYVYRAFGLETHTQGTGDNRATWVGKQGYYDDRESGLYFLKARYYDPASGRFMSVDPKGFAAGDPNLYRYAGNDPVNKTDPSGLDCDPSKSFWCKVPGVSQASGLFKQTESAVRQQYQDKIAPALNSASQTVASILPGDLADKGKELRACAGRIGTDVASLVGRVAEGRVGSLSELLGGSKEGLRPPDILRLVFKNLDNPCLKLLPGFDKVAEQLQSPERQEQLLTLLDLVWRIQENPRGVYEDVSNSPFLRTLTERVPEAIWDVTKSGLEGAKDGIPGAARGVQGAVIRQLEGIQDPLGASPKVASYIRTQDLAAKVAAEVGEGTGARFAAIVGLVLGSLEKKWEEVKKKTWEDWQQWLLKLLEAQLNPLEILEGWGEDAFAIGKSLGKAWREDGANIGDDLLDIWGRLNQAVGRVSLWVVIILGVVGLAASVFTLGGSVAAALDIAYGLLDLALLSAVVQSVVVLVKAWIELTEAENLTSDPKWTAERVGKISDQLVNLGVMVMLFILAELAKLLADLVVGGISKLLDLSGLTKELQAAEAALAQERPPAGAGGPGRWQFNEPVKPHFEVEPHPTKLPAEPLETPTPPKTPENVPNPGGGSGGGGAGGGGGGGGGGFGGFSQQAIQTIAVVTTFVGYLGYLEQQELLRQQQEELLRQKQKEEEKKVVVQSVSFRRR